MIATLKLKVHALAATARVANVPSVISNVFLGYILLIWPAHAHFNLTALALTTTCAILLYIAGNFLNDWHDREWDQSNRPERALPQGLFSPKLYLTTAFILIIAALSIALIVGLPCTITAVAITASIILYTIIHKRTPWSVIPMGLCRALLPVLGFYSTSHSWSLSASLIAASLSAIFYIMGLSLSARAESQAATKSSNTIMVRLLFLPPLLLMLAAAITQLKLPVWACIMGVTPYLIWTLLCFSVHRSPVSRHVSSLLAGIPWVDWMILLPLGAVATTDSTIGQACIIIPAAAFVFGRLLQRYAPAT